MAHRRFEADVVIVGGGLAGMTAAFELLGLGAKVVILDRDVPERFGGLAKESFGGVMMVDTPLQRKNGIRDSPELALADWLSCADFEEGAHWPRKWAELYVHRSGDIIHEFLKDRKVTFLPVVNWPERGLFKPGNSVPRWHIAWGTGFGIIEAMEAGLSGHPHRRNLEVHFGCRVEALELSAGAITGVRGTREENGESFSARGEAVILAAGGMCGGDLSKVRENWYAPWGEPPDKLLNGSHRYADGLIHDAAAAAGATITHLDKQWHYAAGVDYPDADMPGKGLSLVPPRSALWVNALGERIMDPAPLVGYTDTRYLVEQICRQPGKYSYQIMNWKIAAKELAVSGSEHMKAFRNRDKVRLVKELLLGNTELVKRLLTESRDFIAANSLDELVDRMNDMGNHLTVDRDALKTAVKTYDAQIERGPAFFNDDQLRRIANFRTYRGDRLRTCKFRKIDDPKARPLIAVREFILSRKSLGGIQTDLFCRVLNKDGDPMEGLYAAGETAGFGGGGIHGKGSLEGTFLGSCILMGRIAAHHICGKGL
ncbi:FAD-binding dehydrogenase [Desulfoluna butyratoxydans]|uniref:Fad-dependent oxidoreductase 2 fad binding domain n=1 Tax=Desulfoluna butyratoxydans TaxID=231438 RepID=A0A4U8YKC0_9BACT|nr:FAD-binding dehydrogenase [Desulfoluna butyratoxydans]VFQ43897.1 fad-dependent oxidoreductase 2 fad binding domain [Desulfoluna butyratoxydans]